MFLVPFSIKMLEGTCTAKTGKRGLLGGLFFRRTCARTSWQPSAFYPAAGPLQIFISLREMRYSRPSACRACLICCLCASEGSPTADGTCRIPAQQIHGILYRDGVYLAEHRFTQRQHFQLQAAGFGSVALKPCLAAVVYQLRVDVRHYADNTLAAQGQQRYDRHRCQSTGSHLSPHSCASFATWRYCRKLL